MVAQSSFSVDLMSLYDYFLFVQIKIQPSGHHLVNKKKTTYC